MINPSAELIKPAAVEPVSPSNFGKSGLDMGIVAIPTQRFVEPKIGFVDPESRLNVQGSGSMGHFRSHKAGCACVIRMRSCMKWIAEHFLFATPSKRKPLAGLPKPAAGSDGGGCGKITNRGSAVGSLRSRGFRSRRVTLQQNIWERRRDNPGWIRFATRAAKSPNQDQTIRRIIFATWSDATFKGPTKPDTPFNISAEARLKILARMTSLQTCNEKASLRITPCAVRRSHFYRAKFIP
jgi:hypothetical protein